MDGWNLLTVGGGAGPRGACERSRIFFEHDISYGHDLKKMRGHSNQTEWQLATAGTSGMFSCDYFFAG